MRRVPGIEWAPCRRSHRIRLTETVTRIFTAAGTPPAKARTVAELLIDANLTGHDSHGVIRVPQYLESMAKGEIDANATIEVVREGSATALLDGHWDFGQVTMTRAVEVVLDKAQAHGLGAVAVRGANHIGRLGSYVDSIARHNLIGLLYVNAVGIPAYRMAPWGGTESRLATDPSGQGDPHLVRRADRHRHDHHRGGGGQGAGQAQPWRGDPRRMAAGCRRHPYQ